MTNKTNKYLEAYKEASNLTPKDFLLAKVRKANKLVKLACEKAEKYDELKTPQKPYFLNYGGFKIGNYKCPSCDEIINKKNTCCSHCGQKLDWSEEE